MTGTQITLNSVGIKPTSTDFIRRHQPESSEIIMPDRFFASRMIIFDVIFLNNDLIGLDFLFKKFLDYSLTV